MEAAAEEEGAMGVIDLKGNDAIKTATSVNMTIAHEKSILRKISKFSRPHYVSIRDNNDKDDDDSLRMKRVFPAVKNMEELSVIDSKAAENCMRQLILAVAGLHEKCGVVHNDLHVDNIMVERTDADYHVYFFDDGRQYVVPTGGYCPVIIDFGLAVARSQTKLSGCFYYMSDGIFPFDANPIDDAIELISLIPYSKRTDLMNSLRDLGKLPDEEGNEIARRISLYPDFLAELYFCLFQSVVFSEDLTVDDCHDMICLCLNQLPVAVDPPAPVDRCVCGIRNELVNAFYPMIDRFAKQRDPANDFMDEFKYFVSKPCVQTANFIAKLGKFVDRRSADAADEKRRRYDAVYADASDDWQCVRKSVFAHMFSDEHIYRRGIDDKCTSAAAADAADATILFVDYRSSSKESSSTVMIHYPFDIVMRK